jgi:exodeoxyribonuclease VII large subunit
MPWDAAFGVFVQKMCKIELGSHVKNMSMSVLSVSQLTQTIRGLLEPRFRSVNVRGEASNLKVQSSGHVYFSLKDAEAQISAVLFRGNAIALPRMPKDGDQIIATGEISVYPPRGSYQLVVRELQFLGTGELLLKFHQLKEQIQQRGWFDSSRKKPLPKLPRRIGVITSPTGAAIQDILQILTRRFSGFCVILNPVKVQGEGAAAEIAQAIDDMNRYQLADVLIVGRGGGSIEDLWAFNEEIVAKAIFESRIPVISAVGHETDFTIADWVADIRAPTPSAAAEIVIAEKAHLLKQLEKASLQSNHFLSQQIQKRKEKLWAIFKHPLLCQPYSLLALPVMRLDDLKQSIDHAAHAILQKTKLRLDAQQHRVDLVRPSNQICQIRQRIGSLSIRLDETIKSCFAIKKKNYSLPLFYSRLDTSILRHIANKNEQIRQIRSTIASLNPNHLLKMGFCILFSEKDHSVILSVEEMQTDQPFKAVLSDGCIHAKALRIEKTDGPQL